MIGIWSPEQQRLYFRPSLDGAPADGVVVADPAPVDWQTAAYTVVDGVLVAALDVARARQRIVINRGRDAAIDAGVATEFGIFDTNLGSRLLISGAVQAASLALANELPWSISWTMADDNEKELTAAEMISAGLQVAAAVDAIHQRSRVLKGRIEAATTLAEVDAVIWTLEDPE